LNLIIETVEKSCTKCGEMHPATEEYFYKNKITNKKNGVHYRLSSWCKKCSIKLTQKNYDLERRKVLNYGYYHNNEEYRLRQIAYAQTPEYREGQSEWRKKNPDKLRVYGFRHRNHDITNKEWQSCLDVFGNKCAYCGLLAENHVTKRNGKNIIMKLHRDHVDDEGYNDLRNAIPACQSCNTSKHDASLDNWYKTRDFYTEDRYNFIIWWTTEGFKYYIEDKPLYRIIRERNKEDTKYHYNLWSVDEMRNTLNIISTKVSKKELMEDIEEYLKTIIVK